ncbi:MAG: hypothetical protein Q8O37_11005 [Sulfuricellaceae bacterium]|nr:hypothetical protein [Sulfuricellaceae bacterium]
MSDPAPLSLEQAPPIQAPIRFFLSAPLFSLLAAALMLLTGQNFLDSRWNPAMLAATHLLTLGHIGLIMQGAILQMLPVVAGTPINNPLRVAKLVHLSGVTGVLLMCFGLAFSQRLALQLAIPVLAADFLLFAGLVVYTLRHAMSQNMTARAMRLAAILLAATALLGLILLSNHAFGWWTAPRPVYTNLHLSLGLFGWIGILVIGVAFQVVPMFQLTPIYPKTLARWLSVVLSASLAMLAVSTIAGWDFVHDIVEFVPAAGMAGFAITTLWLQAKRKRKLPDVTLAFWRVAMGSLLLATMAWVAGRVFPEITTSGRHGILLGLLMIGGFAMSATNGMLYKITPFLIWFHLQSKRKPGGPSVPNVKLILPERHTRRQMWLHYTAVGLLMAAVLQPVWFFYPAALLFGASSLALWFNLLSAARTYQRIHGEIVRSALA